MDRGYLDFDRLYIRTATVPFCAIRAKSNLQYRRLYPHPVAALIGLRYGQSIVLTGLYPAKDYPMKL